MPEALLEIQHLVTEFDTDEGVVRAIDDVSFTARAGETLGIVGESGCGKSVTALSIMRLLPYPTAWHPEGTINFTGEALIDAPESIMQTIRGNRIAMIFQEPLNSLNPLHSIEQQISEVLLVHKNPTYEFFLQSYLH